MSGKRWTIGFLLLSGALLLLLALCCYVVDPFMQYRCRDNAYFLNARFANPGILKTADYDAVVIGSSVTQNFSMDTFRAALSMEPVKATVGGMSLGEAEDVLALCQNRGKAEHYFICLDNNAFLALPENEAHTFPRYLLDENVFNDYRYLLGYEAWMRYIPVDAALCALDALGVSFSDKLESCRRIDDLEYWQDDAEFGAQYLKDAYTPQAAYAESADLARAERLAAFEMQRAEELLGMLEADPSASYTLFFPPYSALYWHEGGETLLETARLFKAMLTERVQALPNVTLFDFQCMEVVTDLDRYMDGTHYDARVNDEMVACFASGSYVLADAQAAADSHQRLTALLAAFRQANADWLK